ncbi:pentatricopeptide repeat-containing protein [Collybia nuda]|uniref:Pentatricopeptide repeat-containing protein n=1 Tax=Collybia nuda TaxID=64659 RepID=A0A9P5XXZ7_9AGAR|nr:pentatricopeptide repeat-containing protein [Collybia nuda]
MSPSGSLIRLTGLRILTRTSQNASKNIISRYNSTTARDLSVLSRTLLQKLKSSDGPAAIHTYYPALVTELKKTATTSTSRAPSPLNQQQIISLLEVLGASGRPADLQRVEEILSDMPTMFGIEPSIEVHTTILRALIKHGNVQSIQRWLSNMPSRPGHFSPTLEQIHIVLEACISLASFKFMRNLVRSMRQYGCKPTNETYKILIRGRWELAVQEEKTPHVIAFSSILEDMKQAGLTYDPEINVLLYDGYAERGLSAYAEQIQTLYQEQFPDIETPQARKEMELNFDLSQVAQTHGVKAAIALFKSLVVERQTPSAATLRAILRHSRTTDDLRILEEEFATPTPVAHWSILINNNVRTGNLSSALAIYEETKNSGIIPDAALVGPLIAGLCRTASPPSDESLDQALSIYEELSLANPPSLTSEASSNNTEHSTGPDAGIYQVLLRGLASSENNKKYFPIAKSLMEDMESRHVPTNNSLTTSSNIVLLMKRSSSVDEALEVYHTLRAGLDEKGYAIVLNAFCKLSFGDDIQVPSLTNYFEIVKDMRRAGLEITVEVYTILLHRLGVIATQMTEKGSELPSDIRDRLITTTRRTHDLLTLDAAVSPDAYVWNQLMDTYQRLGYFADSYRVWDTMYLSGRFDHVSVSIILDACGYAGAGQVAKRICSNLFRDQFSFNLHNWNTWLECLCRLGRLNDAVKVACMEMGKDQNTVMPDIDSARILIKFGRQHNQHPEVQSRLQRYLPDLWKVLPDDLKQP